MPLTGVHTVTSFEVLPDFLVREIWEIEVRETEALAHFSSLILPCGALRPSNGPAKLVEIS